MLAWKRKRVCSGRLSLTGIVTLLLLLGSICLAGCAGSQWSTEDPYPLGRDMREGFPDLAACVPPAPEGWQVEPMVINSKSALWGPARLDATVEYKAVEGPAEMEIRIYTSSWVHRLVSRSADLERLTFQDRQAGLDTRKDKAELYVLLQSGYVAVFEAFHTLEGTGTVVDFASKTDFDCLDERLHWQ